MQMEVEQTRQNNRLKVWLQPDEYEALREQAADKSLRHEVLVRLAGECGLRRFEIPQLRPVDVLDDKTDVSGEYFIHVREGKDTRSGTPGKPRDVWLPESLERDLLELQYSEELDEQEPYYPVTPRRIAQMVAECADEVAALDEQPGRPEYWRHVSTHDLRRYFAQTLLVRENKNPRVVMRIGGWSSMDALEPYLSRPTPEVVAAEMRD